MVQYFRTRNARLWHRQKEESGTRLMLPGAEPDGPGERTVGLIGLLILLSTCGLPLAATAQTLIFNASPSAQSGEAISLQGSFGSSAKAYVAQGASAAASSLPILVQSANQATVQIPASLRPDLYRVWVVDGGQRSPSVYVNQARGMHFDSPEVTPGGALRLYGRNLQLSGGTAQVRFVPRAGGPSSLAVVNPKQSDAYTLRLTAPTGLQPGKVYNVYVSNGRGGALGETKAEQPITAIAAGVDYFKLGVPWAAKFDFYRNIYNVKTDARLRQKAVGDGVANDQPAIQAAIEQASAEGGGIVFLPAGTYKLVFKGNGINLAPRVVVQGAGPTQTFIKYGYGTPDFDFGVSFKGGSQRTGLSDLAIENVNEQGKWFHNLATPQGTISDIFFNNVHFSFSGEALSFFYGTNRLLFKGCRLISKYNPQIPNSSGPLSVSKATNVILRNNYIQHQVDQTAFNLDISNLVLEGNTFIRDAAVPYGAGQKPLQTRSLSINFAKNVAILGNHFETIHGPAKENGDGETILTEGGGPYRQDSYYGEVSTASHTALSAAQASWKPMTSNAVVVIIYGKGMGQLRKVASNTKNALTVDRAWEVVPDASSRYAITDWSAENWLVKDNVMLNNRGGLLLYGGSSNHVAIVGNKLTNNAGIWVRTGQQNADPQNNPIQIFNMVYNTQIVGNIVKNVSSDAPAYIGVLPYQYADKQTLGPSALGIEIRNNVVQARVPNVVSQLNNELGTEGYYNYFVAQFSGNNGDVPVALGTIFQNNTAINCTNAFYMNSGAYNTLLSNTTLTNVGQLVDDRLLSGSKHASVRTHAPSAATRQR